MDEEKFMSLAIKEAEKSRETLRCGAVIVKDNKIITIACNSAKVIKDASAHAEINAIRKAGLILGDKNLYDCIIYSTCEPCTMCLSAITFAKIKKVVYGLDIKEASPKNIINIPIEDFLAKAPYKIKIIKNFMKEECKRTLNPI